MNLRACEQFLSRERLREVIVGAHPEPPDLLVRLLLGRQKMKGIWDVSAARRTSSQSFSRP